MHIPTGFLKPEVLLPLGAVSIAGVAYALKRTGETIDDRKTPVIGVMAAFIFAAQMVNFPVLGGTSGHLLGASLAVATLGMWPGMLALTSVVLIQALIFQDGGLDALGANVFNMAISGCLISGIVISTARKLSPRFYYPSVALAAWLSVFAAAILCSIELALSGTSPLKIVLPAMGIIHAIIGVFEGIITVAALKFITAFNPSILKLENGTPE
jgi:cobalt/nickel transport system permease protein